MKHVVIYGCKLSRIQTGNIKIDQMIDAKLSLIRVNPESYIIGHQWADSDVIDCTITDEIIKYNTSFSIGKIMNKEIQTLDLRVYSLIQPL